MTLCCDDVSNCVRLPMSRVSNLTRAHRQARACKNTTINTPYVTYMGLKFLIYNGRPSITPMKDKCEAIRRLDPPKTETVENFVERLIS